MPRPEIFGRNAVTLASLRRRSRNRSAKKERSVTASEESKKPRDERFPISINYAGAARNAYNAFINKQARCLRIDTRARDTFCAR